MVATKVQSHRKRALVLVALGTLGVLLLYVALLLWFRGDEARILGQVEWPYGGHTYATPSRTPKLLVIRSREELARAGGIVFDGKGRQWWKAFVNKSFGVGEVDFNRQMLVAVVAGSHYTLGYRVEVTKVESDKEHNALRVHWKLHSPDPGQPPPPKLKYPVYPATVVLLKRFDRQVRLEPLDEADQKLVEPKLP
jgi:hypothetical protein